VTIGFDFNLFGHKFGNHLQDQRARTKELHLLIVDGKDVPVPHYGVVLPWDTFISFSERNLLQRVNFVISPLYPF